MWRDLGRPEAALVGVQYVAYGSDLRGRYVVRRSDAAPWLFRGTASRNGSSFGLFGIEVDRTTGASPRGVRVLAEIRNGQGRALTGQMTYYTHGNAKVFATGAFTLGGSATRRYGAAPREPVAPNDARLTSWRGPRPAEAPLLGLQKSVSARLAAYRRAVSAPSRRSVT